MELGFLQTDIMNSLRSSGNTQRRTLIINAGWMQGLHYTAYVISKHYTGQTSNFLREPLLVKALMADLDELPAAVKSSPKVAVIISGLPAVYTAVNIPLDGTISKEGVEKLFSAAQDVVVKIVGG